MTNSRTTHGGKGDGDRSDPKKYREGLSWQHDWTYLFPEEEGLYMVKYYDNENHLKFDTVPCFMKYDQTGCPFLSTNEDELYTFFKNQVGVQWKFLKTLD
jgi:hypothetical protein